jgi:hypothetical protein
MMKRTLLVSMFFFLAMALGSLPAKADIQCDLWIAEHQVPPPQITLIKTQVHGISAAELLWWPMVERCVPVTKVVVLRKDFALGGSISPPAWTQVYTYEHGYKKQGNQYSGATQQSSGQRQEAGLPPGSDPIRPLYVYTDTGLQPGWTYQYRVCAFNNATQAAGCGEVSVKMGVPAPAPMPDPPKPLGLVAMRTSASKATVVWKTQPGDLVTESFRVESLNAASLAVAVGMPDAKYTVQQTSLAKSVRSADFSAPKPPQPLVLVVRVCAVGHYLVHVACSDPIEVSKQMNVQMVAPQH